MNSRLQVFEKENSRILSLIILAIYSSLSDSNALLDWRRQPGLAQIAALNDADLIKGISATGFSKSPNLFRAALSIIFSIIHSRRAHVECRFEIGLAWFMQISSSRIACFRNCKLLKFFLEFFKEFLKVSNFYSKKLVQPSLRREIIYCCPKSSSIHASEARFRLVSESILSIQAWSQFGIQTGNRKPFPKIVSKAVSKIVQNSKWCPNFGFQSNIQKEVQRYPSAGIRARNGASLSMHSFRLNRFRVG